MRFAFPSWTILEGLKAASADSQRAHWWSRRQVKELWAANIVACWWNWETVPSWGTTFCNWYYDQNTIAVRWLNRNDGESNRTMQGGFSHRELAQFLRWQVARCCAAHQSWSRCPDVLSNRSTVNITDRQRRLVCLSLPLRQQICSNMLFESLWQQIDNSQSRSVEVLNGKGCCSPCSAKI